MSALPLSSPKSSPAQLFLDLWQEANAMTAYQRQTADIGNKIFHTQLAKALRLDDAQAAFDAVDALRQEASKGSLRNEKNGCVIAILRAIDELFYLIHPRAQFVPAAKAARKLPAWLRELRDRRLVFGHYAANPQFRLIARGPLLRRDREETAANAENFADYFTALAIVPHTLRHKLNDLQTEHRVIGLDNARGVAIGACPGEEKVVFIPVAEQASDLHITERQCGPQKFADFRLHPDLHAADIIFAALNSAGPVDIAFAPEFVVTETHADKLADGLQGNVLAAPRMVVAGSGQTNARNEDNQTWNESRILNGIGCELWRQQKIWPAGLLDGVAKKYGMSDPAAKLIMEDTAAGNTLVIADVDGMGRCVVLICQDLHLSSAVKEMLDFFQPDWVFVPILDAGISTGRWAHQEAFAVSGISNARFMVVSSLALANLAFSAESRACAHAIGPKAPSMDGSDKGRVFKEVHVEPGSIPGIARLQWRQGDWQQTIQAAKPIS